MAQVYGSVEFCLVNEWYEVILVSSLLLQHSDLNGCLFGVDNYAGFTPLFPDRGVPPDCSVTLRESMPADLDGDSHASCALWSELAAIDWTESATSRDQRIHEYAKQDGSEQFVSKWLNKPGHDWVRAQLETEHEVHRGDRVFRRPIIRRSEALEDTDFDLLMRLMKDLAERFGEDAVRLVVWFG